MMILSGMRQLAYTVNDVREVFCGEWCVGGSL